VTERQRLSLAALGLGFVALAFLAIAYVERKPRFSEFFIVQSSGLVHQQRWFHPGVPYLWLGLAAAALASAAAIFLSSRWGPFSGRLALGLGLSSIPCLVLAFTLNQGPTITGAYFNRSVGAPASATILTGTWFDPFEFRNPYLWLGLALGFLLASAITFFAGASASPPRHDAREAFPSTANR
jgi:hypothetical protein